MTQTTRVGRGGTTCGNATPGWGALNRDSRSCSRRHQPLFIAAQPVRLPGPREREHFAGAYPCRFENELPPGCLQRPTLGESAHDPIVDLKLSIMHREAQRPAVLVVEDERAWPAAKSKRCGPEPPEECLVVEQLGGRS